MPKGEVPAAASALATPVGQSRRSISVVDQRGASTRALPDSGTVVIGRGPDCELRVTDLRMALRHAELHITAESVEIVDLGSKAGTVIGDTRLAPNEPTALAEGVSVTLGSTVFVLQQTRQAARPRRLLTHGYFEARVDEECARASRGGAAFAILRIRCADARHADTVGKLLGSWTRALDVIGVYSPGCYEVFLAQTDEQRAETIAAEIAAGFRQQAIDVNIDVCCFPRDGRTTEVLVDRAPWRTPSSSTATISDPPPPPPTPADGGGYVGRIEPMLERVASGDISVLLLGETGVGKEVMARRVHALSPRAKNAFVAINCSAISESLLESELFGHEKGAFTGAHQAKLGLLEAADKGTIFLDEIGEMSVTLQAKLLRVLEQREITRVGSLKTRPIDVRFVSATNRDLEREASLGHFRQDLYFRLNGITLAIPPLRERVDEIAGLAHGFAQECAQRIGKKRIGIDSEAMALLKSYHWPGNIRELRNMIERAALLSSGKTITTAHLPTEKMSAVMPAPIPRATVTRRSDAPPHSGPSPTADSLPRLPPPPQFPPEAGTEPGIEVKVKRGDEERRRIVTALERCAGNQTAAARMLGISRRTLVSRLASYDLPRPRKRGA